MVLSLLSARRAREPRSSSSSRRSRMSEGLFQVQIFRVRKLPLHVVVSTSLWLASTLTTSGCLFQKTPRAYVPPPIHPPVALKPPPPPPLLTDAVPEIQLASVELPDLGLN